MARILITDDEEPIRAALTAVLEAGGHAVVQASSAREALRLHQEEPADLVITDLVMREMDGTELLRRLRASDPGLPFIGMSGNKHGTMYLNMAKMIGADCVLEKPIAPGRLLEAVQTALGGRL